jgi:hypothetical protein
VVFFLLILVFNSSVVQTKLASLITNHINKDYSTDINVNQVAIGFKGDVLLKDVFVADQREDTLFYAKKIKTDLNILDQLLDGKFVLHNATLDGFYLRINQYEEDNSLKSFINKLNSKENLKKGNKDLFAALDNLTILNGKIINSNQQDASKDYLIDDISLMATDFYLVGNEIEAQIVTSNFTSKEFGNLESLEGDLFYSPCFMSLNSLKLKTQNSILKGDLSLSNNREKFKNLNDAVFIKADFNQIKFDKEDLIHFVSLPESFKPLVGKLSVNGTLNNLEFTEMVLSNDSFSLDASLKVSGLMGDFPDSGGLSINEFEVFPSRLNSILLEKHMLRIPEGILANDTLILKGNIVYKNSLLKSTLSLTIDTGEIDHQSEMLVVKNNGKIEIDQLKANFKVLHLKLENFNKNLGDVSAYLSLKGDKILSAERDLNYDIDVSNLNLFSKQYKSIRGNGEINDEKITAKISVDDEKLSASLNSAFSFNQPLKKHQLELKFNYLNLHEFNPEFGGGKAVFSGGLNLFFVGNHFDDIRGNIIFKDIAFENAFETFSYNDFIIETNLVNQYRSLKIINSDIISGQIEGGYKLSQLSSLFSNALSEVYSFLPSKGVDENQELSYDIRVKSGYLSAVFPALSVQEDALFKGRLSSSINQSKLEFKIPRVSYNGVHSENFNLQIDTQNPIYSTFVSIGKISGERYNIHDFYTLGIRKNDTLSFRSEFKGALDSTDDFKLNYYQTVSDGVSVFGILPSSVLYRDNLWNINADSDKTHIIKFSNLDQSISLSSFEAESENEHVFVSGNYHSKNDFALVLDLDHVNLDKVASYNPNFELKGNIDLSLNIRRSFSDNTFNLDGEISDLFVNNESMGNFNVFTSGNTQLNSYELNAVLNKNGKKSLKGKGTLLGLDQKPRLDLDFIFDEFDLKFLTPLGKENINNVRGIVKGEINLWGPLDGLMHRGGLKIDNAGFTVPSLNTDYQFENGTSVGLIDQKIEIKSARIVDTKFDTQANLSGVFQHQKFKDWYLKMNIDSDRILMLNIPEEEERVFYGDGFLNGTVNLIGPAKNLTIDVIGSTEEGTNMKIPWADDYGLADTSFIKFIEKSVELKKKNPTAFTLDEFKGLQMNFELDIKPNADVEIVIDKESGSYLRGRGVGGVLLEINNKGEFNIWGDFITYEGIYNFKNLSVIDKKFNLKQGGTIVWEGDPLSAQMDMEAIYEVPGGANPALLLDNPNFNKKIPTEVLIRLQGSLLKPDDPVFEIDFPNASGVVTSEINYRLSDPQVSQLQAISLLSQGIFINEVSVSVQGITNNLYEKASDLFSNILGDNQGKLQVGLNYLQGDNNQTLDIKTEDRLGLTLSTQITDRILLNGKIGVPVGGVEETLIVGDLQIDFILNEDGSLRAKVFNKENEFRYIGDELGYTQGVGISYQVDFDTFRELIEKIVKTNKEDLVLKNDEINDNYNALGVEFINKN